METRRSLRSGSFDVAHPSWMLRLTPMSALAAFCVVMCGGVALWSVFGKASASENIAAVDAQVQSSPSTNAGIPLVNASDSSATSSSDLSGFSAQVIGTLAAQYQALASQGAYSSSTADALTQELAPAVKAPLSYPTFSIGNLAITSDTSYAGMKRYQAALQAAMAPLQQNTTPEISIFASYVQTGDAKYLDQLRAVAREYSDAAQAASKVAVPSDAVVQDAAILNAMEEFSAVLSGLADNAQDPVAVLALLQDYGQAQSDMVSSFDNFASYVSNHSKS